MLTRYHGVAIPAQVAADIIGPQPHSLGPEAKRPPAVGFMFADLVADPANRLPTGEATVEALLALGGAIAAEGSDATGPIPAAFTYFGQFIDHDITLTTFEGEVKPAGGDDPVAAAAFGPLSPQQISDLVGNERTAFLELDSVYGGIAAIEADGRMRIDEVVPAPFGTIQTADRRHDLPRQPMDLDPAKAVEDRKALIGDMRNDENLIVAQLHVAFLRSHNALMARGLSAADAKLALTRRYQWAVLDDFLPRVCDPAIAKEVLRDGAKFWRVASADQLLMPLEFSAAAYRFGHSMVRQKYFHNATFAPETFEKFFTFTALSGNVAPGPVGSPPSPDDPPQFPKLPDNWIIDWPRFFEAKAGVPNTGQNPARLIDTHLAPELGRLTDTFGHHLPGLIAHLAARNLVRGYLLGLPTGQAVARHLGVTPISPAVLRAAIPASLPADVVAKIEKAGFLEKTPLWFYVLAEAGDPAGPAGRHLGAVGSRIVAETLWTLAKFTPDNVVVTPPNAEELATGEFSLAGLIGIGQDSGMPPLA